MTEKIKRFLEISGFKNIAILSSGVLASQIISIGIQPIVTRLYSPENLGAIAIITSFVNMFSGTLNGQYDLCIVSAGSDDEADSVTALALYFGLIVSVILSIGMIIYILLNPFKFKEVGVWIFITIPFIFVSGIINVITSYNNRYGQYKLLATVSVYRSVTSSVVKVVLGLARVGVVGLVISMIISTIAGVKKQSEFLYKNIDKIFSIRKKELKRVLIKYKAQPLFSAPGIFVSSYSYSVIPFFINSLYGIKSVGLFSLSMAMLGIPLTLVSTSASRVFFRNASKEKAEEGNFYKSFKNTTQLLAVLSIIPFMLLFLLAEPLFKIVFGSEWIRSGTYVKLFVPLYWVRFIVTVVISGLIISGKQLLKLIIQCFFIVEVLVITFFVRQYSLHIEMFLSLINYTYMINYLVLLFLVYKSSRTKEAI